MLLSLVLLTASICFMNTSAKTIQGDSPNLILDNPSFANGILPFAKRGECVVELYEEDSQDGDDYSCYISERKMYSHSALGIDIPDVLREQGPGDYHFSFWVKTAKKNQKVKLVGAAQRQFKNDRKNEYMQWSSSEPVEVGNEWVQISHDFTYKAVDGAPELEHCFLYILQRDMNENASNLYDIIVDNWNFIKKGSYIEVTPEPQVEIPSVKKNSELGHASVTEIGAIYYNAWYKTSDQWNKEGTAVTSADETARALSPKQFHYMAPFFASVDKASGRVSFPEQTQAQWKEEMQYAIDAGITYMNYLWSTSTNSGYEILKYHVADKDVNSKIKMCAILQTITNYDSDSRALLFEAMKTANWLTYEDMPVIYIYNATQSATNASVTYLRKKAALAGITQPLYIVGMGYTNKNAALAGAGCGVNAAGFYACGAEAEAEEYTTLTKNSIAMQEKVLGAKNIMGVIPLATMGRNNSPRIVTPVSWVQTSNGATPYGGWYTKDGTAQQIAEHLVEMLNWTKKNADACKPNMINLYAWNEHDEGGWLCPTIECDSNGNVQYDASGKAKRNTSRIDAVKGAIAAYKKYEKYPTVMVNVNGDIIEGSVDDVVATPTPIGEAAPSANVSQTPADGEQGQISALKNFSKFTVVLEAADANLKRKTKYIDNDISQTDWTKIGVVFTIDSDDTGDFLTLAGDTETKYYLDANESIACRIFARAPRTLASDADSATAISAKPQIAYSIDCFTLNKEGVVSSPDPATPTPTPGTPTPTAGATTPEPKDLVNLLTEADNYPNITLNSKKTGIQGTVLQSVNENTTKTSFFKEGTEGYKAENDLDGNGYILMEDRQCKWGDIVGPCIDFNQLADIYGEGDYTYKISVKLASAGTSEAYLQAQCNRGGSTTLGGNISGAKVAISSDAYTELVMNFKITKEDGIVVVAVGEKTIKLNSTQSNRLMIMIDQTKNVYYDGLSLTEASHVKTTPTPPVATPTPKPLKNLLEEAGEYPIKLTAEKPYGNLLSFMGTKDANYTLMTKGSAGYEPEKDLDGMGYTIVKNRSRGTLTWSTAYTGYSLSLSKLYEIYGEGEYEYTVYSKLLSGEDVTDAKWEIEISKDAETNKRNVINGTNQTVTADEFTAFNIKFKLIKENDKVYVTNEDGSKKIAIDTASATNRVFVRIDETRDIVVAGLKLTEASHYANNSNGDPSTTGDILPVALVSTAVLCTAAAVVVAKKKKED